MSTQKNFDKFCENIQLTSAQREDAIIKHTGVCKKLHDCFYPDREYNGDTKLLIGSYGKDTHIRPARDIDVIFIMPQEKFDQYDDNQSNGQSQLLQDVKKILEEKYPDTPIEANGKVVVLEFADTQHSVDLLPTWENEDGTFTIPNSEDGGSWENWNPREEIQKIKDSDAKTGKTKSLIRMMKKWTETCGVKDKIKSVEIENKVLDFFQSNSPKSKDAFLVKDFLEFSIQNTTNEETKSHLTTAFDRATKACDFESKNDLEKAVEEWKKVFGDDFPKLDEDKNLLGSEIEDLFRIYPSVKEKFLDKDYGINFSINPDYVLKIDALITQDGFRTNWLSELIKRGYPLVKKKKLEFSISKNNVEQPYEVKWKVRNFGEEAKLADDLRGEISDDLGYEKKKEHTKYTGEHYVECYIIKDNVCVARDMIKVPIRND